MDTGKEPGARAHHAADCGRDSLRNMARRLQQCLGNRPCLERPRDACKMIDVTLDARGGAPHGDAPEKIFVSGPLIRILSKQRATTSRSSVAVQQWRGPPPRASRLGTERHGSTACVWTPQSGSGARRATCCCRVAPLACGGMCSRLPLQQDLRGPQAGYSGQGRGSRRKGW